MDNAQLAALATEALTFESRDGLLELQAKFFDVPSSSEINNFGPPGVGPVTFEQQDAFMAAIRRISDARSHLLDAMSLIENVSRAGGGGPEMTAVLVEAGARASRALNDGETFIDTQETEDAALDAKSWRRLIPGFLRNNGTPATHVPVPEFLSQTIQIENKGHGPDRRWTMFVGHNGEDREKEWLTEEGFRLNVKAINETGNFPEAWVAHVPGSRWGVADFADLVDGVYVVSGLVDDTDTAHAVADTLASKAAEMGVSHSYAIIEQVGPEVRRFFDYEVSVLPRTHAALPETGIIIGAKESTMVSEEQRNKINEALGPKLASKVLEGVDAINDFVDGAGIARKDAKPEAVIEAERVVAEAQTALETANKAAGIAEPPAATEPPAEPVVNVHNTPSGDPPATPPAPPTEPVPVLADKAITDAIDARMKEVLAPLGEVIGEMSMGMKVLLESDDSKTADRIRNAGPAHVASKAAASAATATPEMAAGPGQPAPLNGEPSMGDWFAESMGFGPDKTTEPVTS